MYYQILILNVIYALLLSFSLVGALSFTKRMGGAARFVAAPLLCAALNAVGLFASYIVLVFVFPYALGIQNHADLGLGGIAVIIEAVQKIIYDLPTTIILSIFVTWWDNKCAHSSVRQII